MITKIASPQLLYQFLRHRCFVEICDIWWDTDEVADDHVKKWSTLKAYKHWQFNLYGKDLSKFFVAVTQKILQTNKILIKLLKYQKVDNPHVDFNPYLSHWDRLCFQGKRHFLRTSSKFMVIYLESFFTIISNLHLK